MSQIKTIIVDPRIAGISGDMFVASLLDLGGSIDKIYTLAEIIEKRLNYCDKFKVRVRDVIKSGIRAKDVYLEIEEHRHGVSAIKIKNYALEVGEESGLSDRGLSIVAAVLNELIDAESKIHGIPPDSVHFHEIASADTVFDVVGSVLLLEDLGYLSEDTEIYSTPPALGGGFIKIAHGKLPVPAPATLEILRKHGCKFSSTPVEAELTTPTGAAILVTLTENIVDFYPAIALRKIGYGAGKKDLGGIPNVLRVIEGSTFKATFDKIIVLETNIDDVPGEILGYLVGKLLEKGALDVSIIPATGKKNRPVHIVKVLADYHNYQDLLETLMNETGTLGVRVLETPRIVAERTRKPVQVTVMGKCFDVRVKVSKTKTGKIINVKPEYEDLRKISEELNIPLRKVLKKVEEQLKDYQQQ